MLLYGIYSGYYIKNIMLKNCDYVYDDIIKNMDIDDNVQYGVRVRRIDEHTYYYKFNIDFIEAVPADIVNKLDEIKKLEMEVRNFEEQQRTK